jgi:hypothetical protein
MSGHKRATISLSEFDLNRLEKSNKLKQVEDYRSIQTSRTNQKMEWIEIPCWLISKLFEGSFSEQLFNFNNEFQSEIQLLDEQKYQ